MRRQLTVLFAGALMIAALGVVNAKLGAIECIKDCGCGDFVRDGDSPDLACPYQQMCKFTECSQAKAECTGWTYPTYRNACVTAPTCPFGCSS